MTNEEMDRAIAEHLGWVAHPTCKKVWRTPEQAKTNMELIGTVNGPWSTESSGPPKYSTDLNAMHEAEKKIVDWVFWRIQLSHVVGTGYAPDLDICEDIKSFASATATQRAEAFLRTVGKYSDATATLP